MNAEQSMLLVQNYKFLAALITIKMMNMKKFCSILVLVLLTATPSFSAPISEIIVECRELAAIIIPVSIAKLDGKLRGQYTEEDALDSAVEANIEAQIATLRMMSGALSARATFLEKKGELRACAAVSRKQRQELQQLALTATKKADLFFKRSYCVRQKCGKHSGLKITCPRCNIARYCNEQCQQADNNSHEKSCAQWHKKKIKAPKSED